MSYTKSQALLISQITSKKENQRRKTILKFLCGGVGKTDFSGFLQLQLKLKNPLFIIGPHPSINFSWRELQIWDVNFLFHKLKIASLFYNKK